MLNESVLSEEDIVELFEQLYGMDGIKEIQLLNGGSAGIYLVDFGTEHQKYILKEFQKGYPERSIINEVDVSNYLSANGIRTSEFIKNKEDGYIYKYKKRFLSVQKFIDGYVPQMYSSPQWLMDESAQLLGKINHVLSTYRIRRYEFKSNWLSQDIVTQKAKKFQDYIEKAQEMDDEFTGRIVDDLNYKLSLIDRLFTYEFNRENITFVNSHGDYSNVQLLCKNNHINSVIDFASACNLPAVWEIIRSFTYADKGSKDAEVDLDALKRYIKNYLKYSPLKENDMKSIFNVYASQLILSSYGYKEYFKKDIQDKVQIVSFGFWRTNLLRFMIEHEAEYTDELVRWFNAGCI